MLDSYLQHRYDIFLPMYLEYKAGLHSALSQIHLETILRHISGRIDKAHTQTWLSESCLPSRVGVCILCLHVDQGQVVSLGGLYPGKTCKVPFRRSLCGEICLGSLVRDIWKARPLRHCEWFPGGTDRKAYVVCRCKASAQYRTPRGKAATASEEIYCFCRSGSDEKQTEGWRLNATLIPSFWKTLSVSGEAVQ